MRKPNTNYNNVSLFFQEFIPPSLHWHFLVYFRKCLLKKQMKKQCPLLHVYWFWIRIDANSLPEVQYKAWPSKTPLIVPSDARWITKYFHSSTQQQQQHSRVESTQNDRKYNDRRSIRCYERGITSSNINNTATKHNNTSTKYILSDFQQQ